MHKLAAALTVTLNVLLAASLATGARAPPSTTTTPTLARGQAAFAPTRAFRKKQELVAPRKKQTPCKDRRLSDHTRMAHLDTMQF